MFGTMLVKMYSIRNMKPPSRFVVPGGIPQMSSSSSQVVNLIVVEWWKREIHNYVSENMAFQESSGKVYVEDSSL